MTVFKCKMCGGDLHVESGKTVGVCEYCGTQQTLPKLDNDRRAQMYDRANPFRCNNDHDKAAGIYEMILNEDPTGAEAYEEEAIAIDKFKDMQLNLATEKSKHISSFAEAAEILTQLEGYKNSNDLLRLMKDKIKNITQTALNSNDIQVKYDTIDQLHAIGSFGDAEQLAEQLIEHVNTLVAQMIEGANTLDKINQLAPLEEAINMLSPFVERSDAAAEFMQKLIAEREALISARKKVEKRKTRKRNIYIAAGAALLVFIMAWISTNGFADIRYSATYSLGYDLIKVYKDGNYGIINKFGFEVLPCVYDDIYDFDRYAYVYGSADRYDDGFAEVVKGGKYGLINTSGKLIVPCIYDNIYDEFREGFNEGLVEVNRDGKYGLIDSSGKEVVPAVYGYIREFKDGLAEVSKDGKYGHVNSSGEEVVPVVYDSIGEFKDGLAVVKKGVKYGLVDRSGKEVAPVVYDEIYKFEDGLAEVSKDGKYGLIDRSGKEILPCVYDLVDKFYDGLAIVKKGLKCGLVDTSGKEVLPVVYDFIKNDFKDELAVVKKEGKYGLVDRAGKEVVPCAYDQISGSFENDLTSAEKNGRSIYLNKSGKEFTWEEAMVLKGVLSGQN